MIDGTTVANEPLAYKEDIDGYPTLLLYKNGDRLTEYTGDRTAE